MFYFNGQEARTIVNLGLSAMLLFGVFISIFVGVSLVSKEIESYNFWHRTITKNCYQSAPNHNSDVGTFVNFPSNTCVY